MRMLTSKTVLGSTNEDEYSKFREHYDKHHLPTLSHKQHYALNLYSGSHAFSYNEGMREGKGKLPRSHLTSANHSIQQHIDKPLSHPTHATTTVWRGDQGNHIRKLKPGTTFSAHHPISTTFEPETAKGFGEQPSSSSAHHYHLSKIKVEKGTHHGMPQYGHESELTLHPHTVYTVEKHEHHEHNGEHYHITHLTARNP